MRTARHSHRSFVSATSRLDPVAVAQAADADNVDGIVVLNDDRSQLVQALSALGKPVVLINGEDPAMIVDTVTAENRFGARLGIEHLLSLGHRNILHITEGAHDDPPPLRRL